MARQYEREPLRRSFRSLVSVPDELDIDGVLITGVYGTGKSSVAAEIAETLERRGVPYGALDLDWLGWMP
jgi:Mrp family chromosome partitioning ATPase